MSVEYKIKAIEDEIIVLTEKKAKMSRTIKDMIEDFGSSNVEIPVNVKINTLKKINIWMEHYQDINIPEDESEDRKLPELSDWDKEFFGSMSDEEKTEIIISSNYLDMKHLLDLVCISVGELIKGLGPDDIKKCLVRTSKPIPTDFMKN